LIDFCVLLVIFQYVYQHMILSADWLGNRMSIKL